MSDSHKQGGARRIARNLKIKRNASLMINFEIEDS